MSFELKSIYPTVQLDATVVHFPTLGVEMSLTIHVISPSLLEEGRKPLLSYLLALFSLTPRTASNHQTGRQAGMTFRGFIPLPWFRQPQTLHPVPASSLVEKGIPRGCQQGLQQLLCLADQRLDDALGAYLSSRCDHTVGPKLHCLILIPSRYSNQPSPVFPFSIEEYSEGGWMKALGNSRSQLSVMQRQPTGNRSGLDQQGTSSFIKMRSVGESY